MPIYEYACESCRHQFEKLVRIGAEAPPCPECEAVDVKKLVSASGFILKGSGWYKDHYGLKKSSGSSESAGSSSSAGTSSSTESAKSSGDSSKSSGDSSKSAGDSAKSTTPKSSSSPAAA